MTEWEHIAYKLFVALDDIDTSDDLAKGNGKLYRNLVRRHHKTRFDVLNANEIDLLYDKYHKLTDGVMKRNLDPSS